MKLESVLLINDSPSSLSSSSRFQKFPFLRCLHGGQVIFVRYSKLPSHSVPGLPLILMLAQGGDRTFIPFIFMDGGVYSSVHSFDCSCSLLYDAPLLPLVRLSLGWMVDTRSRPGSLLSLSMTSFLSFGHVTPLGASGPSSHQAKTRRGVLHQPGLSQFSLWNGLPNVWITRLMGLTVAGLRATIYPLPVLCSILTQIDLQHYTLSQDCPGALGCIHFSLLTVMRVCLDHFPCEHGPPFTRL